MSEPVRKFKFFPQQAFPPGFFPPQYWPELGAGGATRGHGRTYAGSYLLAAELQMIEADLLARFGRKDRRFKSKELLDLMIKRMEEEDTTSLTLFLADV
jgi:hypothetical protein